MKSSPIKLKQKLSPYAAKKKAARDLAYAKSPARQYKKAQNQRLDRAEGTVGDGMDRHHTESGDVRKVSIKDNRGNFGNGTKNEKTKNMSKPFKMKGFSGFGNSPLEQKTKGETTTTKKKHTINTMHGGLPGDSQVIGSEGKQWEPKDVTVETKKSTPTTDKKGRTRRTTTSTEKLLNPQEVEVKNRQPAHLDTRRDPSKVETTKESTKIRKKSQKPKKSHAVTYNPDGTVKGDKVQVTKYDRKGNVKKIVNRKATKRRLRKTEK